MPKRDKNRQSLFSKATLSAAMAENPSVMTAAGWRSNENGDIVQDMQDDPGVRKLANNLSEISLIPLYDLGIGFAGEALLSIPKVRNAVASYRLAKEIGKGAKSFSKASKRSAGKLVPYSDGLRESVPISKELPVSSSDASITRAKSYSGYTPTDQAKAQSFVDDIKEALDWESKRGKALPSTNEYINLNPRDYIGDGREAYVYSNPENPEEVLKVMHGEAVPGVGIRQVPNFETPEEAIGFAERYVSEKNMRPYNLVENVVGVTDSGSNGYAPVLSQRKVVPANKAYNKTWEEIDADITKLGERIGDRHYTSNIRARADRKYIPEAGRRPTNNIIYENDFQKAMVDPDNGKVYFETKDLRKDNVGYLKDGSLIGFDLFKNGGFVDKEKIDSLKLRINRSSKAVKNFAVNRIREVLDSEARRADSYSKKKYTFDEAYRDARSKGQRTFYWDGKYYNTDYEGVHGKRYREDVASGKAAAFQEKYPGFTNPELRKEKQEELDTYGITNEQTQNKNIVSQRLLDNIDPFGDYDLTQAIDAVVLNHKQRKGDALTQAKNETHIAQLRNYLGYPAEPIKFTTPDGAPVKISKYTPTTGDSQEGKYYYTFKRNPFGYQPQNQERYLSEYERLKSIGDKYLDKQFYDDAHKYGLDYATKIADENTQAWSDYYDNHRDEIQGYGPLESAFIITPETGSKEQRRSYGNAGGLGNFTVYNNPTYSSFYDLWDIGIGQGKNTKTFGVGKPFEYYDRRYHNPAEEPNIDKLYAEFSGGGDIHIKESKKGTFTAAAKAHGKSVQAFASQVLANKDNYSHAMVKKANFARNFGGHKHGDGGYLLGNVYDVSESEYQRLLMLGYGVEKI